MVAAFGVLTGVLIEALTADAALTLKVGVSAALIWFSRDFLGCRGVALSTFEGDCELVGTLIVGVRLSELLLLLVSFGVSRCSDSTDSPSIARGVKIRLPPFAGVLEPGRDFKLVGVFDAIGSAPALVKSASPAPSSDMLDLCLELLRANCGVAADVAGILRGVSVRGVDVGSASASAATDDDGAVFDVAAVAVVEFTALVTVPGTAVDTVDGLNVAVLFVKVVGRTDADADDVGVVDESNDAFSARLALRARMKPEGVERGELVTLCFDLLIGVTGSIMSMA